MRPGQGQAATDTIRFRSGGFNESHLIRGPAGPPSREKSILRRLIAGPVPTKRAIADGYRAHPLGIRAEHLQLRDASAGIWSCNVLHSKNLDADTFIHVDNGAAELPIVRQGGESLHQPGETLFVSSVEKHLYRFDKTGHPIAQ